MHTATLRCGTVLYYETRGFLPAAGESVPCQRHGYCVVEGNGERITQARRRPGLRRDRPKAQDELLSWLRDRSVTTIHALRRHRFTLRMIAAAERDGLVAVDLEAGTVTVCRTVDAPVPASSRGI